MTFPDTLTAFGKTYVPKAEPQGTLPAGKTWVRVLHQCEIPAHKRHVPARMPEVVPLEPNHHSIFGKYWQILSRNLNPLLTPGNWTAVYHWKLWITNGQGFSNPADRRANYITGQHLTYPLPKVESLTCGGNLLSVLGETTVLVAGERVERYIVETLDSGNPAPTVEWIKARPWFITEATKLDGEGQPTRFPQGQQPNGYQPGARHPLVMDPSRFRVMIDRWRCVEWTDVNPPDPYKVYL